MRRSPLVIPNVHRATPLWAALFRCVNALDSASADGTDGKARYATIDRIYEVLVQ